MSFKVQAKNTFAKLNALSQKDKNCYAGMVGCVHALFFADGVGAIFVFMLMMVFWMMTQ